MEALGTWVCVSEKLPEAEKEVLIITERGIMTTAMYEDGNMDEENSNWYWNDIEYRYDEDNDIRYIPEGWWEYRHFNADEVYNNVVDDKVLAWMELPKNFLK